MLKIKFLLIACILGIVKAVHPTFDVIFQWNNIAYNFPLSETNVEQEFYIAENNAIAGIKLWKNKIYLTIPRWKKGVPVTLAVISAIPINGIESPNLDAYPSWDMQTIGNCEALQSVQNMEIDPQGRMWILDTGRVEIMTSKSVKNCSPRLVILDLENNGSVLRSYTFPENVASGKSAYLNNIVLDHEDGGTAYITDAEENDPGIIVYSLKDNTSWKVRHDSMKAQEDAVNFKVANIPITKPVNIDGIALSPPGPDRLVYYSPLSSLHLYSIPVSILKNPSIKNIANYTIDLGIKQSQTDGMIMTNQGHLYLGLLNDDSIAVSRESTKYPSKYPVSPDEIRPLYRDHNIMQWIDTFAIDENGRLWCVANGLQNFINNRVDKSQINYRILRSLTTAKNYQYFENGTKPDLPEISQTTSATVKNYISLSLINTSIICLLYVSR